MEIARTKTKQETIMKERIVFRGVKKKMNGKVVFMQKFMRCKGCLEQVMKKLEDESVRQKLTLGAVRMGGKAACLTFCEKDLEILYDEIFKRKLAGFLRKNEDPVMEALARPLSENGEEVRLDATYPLVYAIVTNERCRQQLKSAVEDRNIYYEYFEKSEYKNPNFEGFLRVEFIWDARLMLGILERMRQEENADDYYLLMDIIYAGYGYVKRKIKGKAEIDMDLMREIFSDEISAEDNMLPTVSRMFLLMIMAEDIGILFLWDYETLALLPFFKKVTIILKDGERVYRGDENFPADGQKAFLKKYDEKYGTHKSLLGLLGGAEDDKLGELMMRIFELYQISPRKFTGYDLTEEETADLLSQSRHWSLRTYATGVIFAQLCKYIRQLEEGYLAISENYTERQIWLANQEKEMACRQREQTDREIRQLLVEKQGLKETVLKQEQEIRKLQKQLKDQKKQEAEQLLELQEIRSYVYSLSDEPEEADSEEAAGQDMSEWEDKRVLVVGGHINWQNKMRELFPKWQFVLPGQSNIDDSVIRGKDLIICNTEVLSHSCYHKVLSARERRQKLYYAHSNNIQKCLKELKAQNG